MYIHIYTHCVTVDQFNESFLNKIIISLKEKKKMCWPQSFDR